MQFEDMVALLPDYLDGKLSPRLSKMIDEQLKTNVELQDALATLNTLNQGKQSWLEEPVPEWHRTGYLARRQKSNQGWLPWFSMATSFAAVLLVLFRIEIVTSNEGVHIGFGEPTTKVAMQEQNEQQMEDWRNELQAYVGHRLLEYENEQLRRDQKLVATMLELNTEQRRQDLTQLTSYLAEQRDRDIQITQSQYQTLFENQEEDRLQVKQLYASLDKETY
ncbi:MAG: hypothetical protein VW882_00595 [Gammaproteobacteria bacterium]